MARQVDTTKKQLVIEAREEQVINTNTYKTQRQASKKYETTIEQLTVRLPKGSKKQLTDYLESTNKYNSVNAMIKALIEKEIGHSLS